MAQVGFMEGLRACAGKVRQHPLQLSLAMSLVMLCGATLKFQTFPMPWIAGQSSCVKMVHSVQQEHTISFQAGGNTYEPTSWIETKPNCKEKAKVFVFVTESFTITTAFLVFFGFTKAIFNFVCGVACDRWGRKWTLIAGWALAVPMPFMVLAAENWWVAAVSNLFLGMQQALVWSATIFIMIDYLGQSNSGVAVGVNETIGYTTIAIVTQLAAAIMDEDEPRKTCYYIVMGLIATGLLLGLVGLKESKPVALREEADLTGRTEEETALRTNAATLTWPSGRSSVFSLSKSAFVYTSFINRSLMSICFAGLMVNFISGFAWGLFAKWMKNDYFVDGALRFEAMSKETVASVTLCYGIPKGVLQWVFGFVGDRIGRRFIITGGLGCCTLGLLVIAISGEASTDPFAGFCIGALLMGVGTAMMYSNNLAAVCDHADPSWRSSALGAYRFWRDSGYAIGALITGLFADSIGIFGSVLITAALTLAAGLSVFSAYRDVSPQTAEQAKAEQKLSNVENTEATSQ